MKSTAERARLEAERNEHVPWKKWGPYLSERQWGTVREDYSNRKYDGDNFMIECPTGSGRKMNLYQVVEEIARRLASIFQRDKEGRRPVYGGTRKFQEDPHWRDYILFYG